MLPRAALAARSAPRLARAAAAAAAANAAAPPLPPLPPPARTLALSTASSLPPPPRRHAADADADADGGAGAPSPTPTATASASAAAAARPWKWLPPRKPAPPPEEDYAAPRAPPLPSASALLPTADGRRPSSVQRLRPVSAELAVTPGVAPSGREVAQAFEAEGGAEVSVLRCEPLFGDADVVLCTGRSVPHIRKLARLLATNIKQRGLQTANPSRPIEGEYASDGWMVVDGRDVIAHLFVPAARERLDLDTHFRQVRARHALAPPLPPAPEPEPPPAPEPAPASAESDASAAAAVPAPAPAAAPASASGAEAPAKPSLIRTPRSSPAPASARRRPRARAPP